MILISLDEQGNFENTTQENKPIFIAGVMYDDKNESQEVYFERKRIQSYYESVIKDASIGAENESEFIFPNSLHSNNSSDRSRDSKVVAPVKQLVKQTLPEFIQSGTYKGQVLTYTNSQGNTRPIGERKGRYHIFCILRSDDGLEQYMVGRANIFTKDDYASNLYFHMSSRIVNRLLLHNPVIPNVGSATLNIATRASKTLNFKSEEARIYRELGYDYQATRTDDNQIYFSLANADVYRSMLATEMLHCKKTNLKIESFSVSSINYKRKNGKAPKNMEFLYLADSICSILGYHNNGANAKSWLDSINSRISNISGDDSGIIFVYDDIDVIFDQAWTAYEEGDIYRAFGLIWDGCRSNNAFASYYKKRWFSILEERIKNTASLSDYNTAVYKLSTRRFTNTFVAEKGKYIFDQLVSMLPNIEEKFHNNEERKVLYQLYDSGISVYTHIGDSATAEEYFNKCCEFAYYIGVEEFLDTKNRMAVYYTDAFKWDDALNLANENINYHDYLIDMKKEIEFPDADNESSMARSIAFSQRGQIKAFFRLEEAENDFKEALRHFSENSFNYKFTQSFLLHHYLDMKISDKYKEESKSYFGGERKLSKQFKYILTEGSKEEKDRPVISLKFALYIFVKGLYTFYLNQISDDLWAKLCNIEKELEQPLTKNSNLLTGHPMELIYKYMALIAYHRKDNDTFALYYKKSQTILSVFGPTEVAINMFTCIEFEELQGHIEERDKIIGKFFTHMQQHFPVFKDMVNINTIDEQYDIIKRYITFMYR